VRPLLSWDPTADIHATQAIHAVIQSGRVIDRGSLDRMLADVRPPPTVSARRFGEICG
jgi:hypothetical protein